MDLGRSSHIHITTWGTLSRQKKGQRSKGAEGASISLSIALSNSGDSHPTSLNYFMSISFCDSCCDAQLLFCSCSALSDFLFFPFFEAWRRLPPAATEDNYTNTDKSASTVTHSRIGVLPYATSYNLQRLCKTEKKTARSGARHKGEWCAESRRDSGRWKEKGGSGHLAHRASPRHTEVREITQVS